MSIAVPLEELADEVAKRGAGYLLTTTADSRPHVMHLEFAVEGTALQCSVGRSAARNIESQPAVTLLWSPLEDGYSLIVDGEATVDESGATITARSAVLHRPAAAS